ncbi:DUF6691 family protein [Aquitalea sp. ASV15]|uniref:DUF6691 family protein n=1 Tax=Aquitalea sp. ASV15 TaxID=2795104 RepID=UPI0018EDE6F5|nr:DUF6691 family protein [Aquitalea sp. ASV15]
MAKLLSALLAGLLFGFGLLLSGMSNPAKVLGFLDVAGRWDPSLALVMAGAIAVAFFAFRRAERQTHALLGDPLQLPDKNRLTLRLVLGSLLFGLGWGLAGICPGPGLVLAGMALPAGWWFVAAMLLGMLLFRPLSRCLP